MNVVPTPAPAVAGLFYPAEPAQLQATVDALLDRARAQPIPTCPAQALIVPHAGYRYSGATAARGWASVGATASPIETIVLLAPAHRCAFHGIALPGSASLRSPLGEHHLNLAQLAPLLALPAVQTLPEAFRDEHAIEVQLPFLARCFPQARIVPLLVGDCATETACEVLEKLWALPNCLIVVSSDLSHYHPERQAREIDQATIAQILTLQPTLSHRQACGATPINALLMLAARNGLQPRLLERCSSAAVSGDTSRVVGYAAIAFYPNDHEQHDPALGRAVLSHAAAAIAEQIGRSPPRRHPHVELERNAACFVTLHRGGRLRGCCGHVEPRDNLHAAIADAARAACADPRFEPLRGDEYDDLEIEVSLLSALQPLHCRDQAEAVLALRPGMDGVALSAGWRRAVFLPQVWQQLPDAQRFLNALKRKAGLSIQDWPQDTRLQRFSVRHWRATTDSLQ